MRSVPPVKRSGASVSLVAVCYFRTVYAVQMLCLLLLYAERLRDYLHLSNANAVE